MVLWFFWNGGKSVAPAATPATLSASMAKGFYVQQFLTSQRRKPCVHIYCARRKIPMPREYARFCMLSVPPVGAEGIFSDEILWARHGWGRHFKLLKPWLMKEYGPPSDISGPSGDSFLWLLSGIGMTYVIKRDVFPNLQQSYSFFVCQPVLESMETLQCYFRGRPWILCQSLFLPAINVDDMQCTEMNCSEGHEATWVRITVFLAGVVWRSRKRKMCCHLCCQNSCDQFVTSAFVLKSCFFSFRIQFFHCFLMSCWVIYVYFHHLIFRVSSDAARGVCGWVLTYQIEGLSMLQLFLWPFFLPSYVQTAASVVLLWGFVVKGNSQKKGQRGLQLLCSNSHRNKH